ncbi:Hypothetical_protein [Hexamita inflata]|uniref:Hypothetical_protein n=1 Tax=Hexamita inflata TaxID=28002 RepID=A0AA86Q3B3_9EUKA|nr:Hypothetical protein HINF_LOCUS38098 [Hexamita inflata]
MLEYLYIYIFISSSYSCITVYAQIIYNHGLYVGAISGIIYSNVWHAQNVSVDQSHISGNLKFGLLSASSTAEQVVQCSFTSSYIIADKFNLTFQGGIIGDTANLLLLSIQMCVVSNLSLFSNNSDQWSISAGLIGDTHATPIQIQQMIVKLLDIQSYGAIVQYVSSASLIACVYDISTSIADVQIINISLIASTSTNTAFCSGIISSITNQVITGMGNIQLTEPP